MSDNDGFINLWSRVYPDLPLPEKEYRFHPKRRWRFDYAWPDSKVCLEVEGGGWIAGRHHRAKGFEKDIEKYNAATSMGWRVYRATWQMLEDDPSQVLGLVAETIKKGG